MARPITSAVWLTRFALNSLKQKSLLIEIDQGLLAQIQRMFPATLAGFCVWTAEHTHDVWVKWHWYFDEDLKQFVVPPHGIETNVSLHSADGAEMSAAIFARHALRRIRRRHDWKPWLQLHESRRTPRLRNPAAPRSGPPFSLMATRPPSPKPYKPPEPQSPPDVEPEFSAEDVAVMRLMEQGLRRKQIAAALNLSTATIDRRLAAIRERLSVDRNATIGQAARWRGLI